MRRTVAAEMSATIPSAMSWRASSRQSHWERLRPSVSGLSQARRTTWIATSGGKKAFGPAARGISEPCEALRKKAPGPLAHDAPLGTNHLPHVGLGEPSRQQEDDSPPPREPGGNRGGTLPAFQGIAFWPGQDNVQG
jgi:hypothetical protein